MPGYDKIWEDPLNYNFMVDGPPYLPKPNQNARVANARKASAPDNMFLVNAFFEIFGSLMASSLIHQTNHWRAKGPNFYSDHLLFQRIYGDVQAQIDPLVEKLLGFVNEQGWLTSENLLQYFGKSIMKYSSYEVYLQRLNIPKRKVNLLLSTYAVRDCLQVMQTQYEALEEKGFLSSGVDNMLQGFMDKQEEFLYLLKQQAQD